MRDVFLYGRPDWLPDTVISWSAEFKPERPFDAIEVAVHYVGETRPRRMVTTSNDLWEAARPIGTDERAFFEAVAGLLNEDKAVVANTPLGQPKKKEAEVGKHHDARKDH